MPVAGAAITAAGALGSAYLQSRSNNRATRAQQDSTNQALELERQRDAEKKRIREERYAEYKRQHDAWLERNFGIKPNLIQQGGGAGVTAAAGGNPFTTRRLTVGDIGSTPAPSTQPPAPPPSAPGGPMPPPQSPSAAGYPSPSTRLLDSQGGADAPGTTPNPSRLTIGDMSGWTDWTRYGVPGR